MGKKLKCFKHVIIAMVYLIGCAASADVPFPEYEDVYTATVEEVIDGNTLWIKFDYEYPERCDLYEKARLIGVSRTGRYEYMSVDFLENLLGNEIDVEVDRSARLRNRDGSINIYVWYGGDLVNSSLIRKGLAYYDSKHKFDGERMRIFQKNENEAREKRNGFWFEENARRR